MKRPPPARRRAAAAGALLTTLLLPSAAAMAQQPSPGSTVMWGSAAPFLGSGGSDGAAGHVANGNAAGQAEAARNGWLLGPSITVNAIGVQNIISVTGDHNSVAADQSGTNSGSITNAGRVTARN